MGEISVGHVFVLNTSTVLTGIQNQSAERALQVTTPLADGNVYPLTSAVVSQSDTINGTCFDIGDLLTLSGAGGAAVTSCVVFDAQVARTGAKAGTSVHVKRAVATGLLVTRSVTLSQRDNATANFSILCYSSTGTTGIVTTATEALTNSTAGGADELYGLGPLSINGTVVDDVTQAEIDFGISVEDLESEGDTGVKLRTVMGVTPRIRFRTANAAFAATVGDTGLALSSTGCIAVARKRASGATHYIAAGTAEHIKFTIAAGMIVPASHGGRRIEGAYEVVGHYGAAAPLVLAIDSTYS